MPPAAPTKLGRYEIVEEIGKGAMGVVYLAKDPLIGRLVALKTFRVGYSARDHELEQFRHRFVREAQSAGILSHPSIVTIHDVVDEGDTGVCFIAMEYIRGTNLKLLLQRPEPLDMEFVISAVIQISEALAFAHSKGVVHRDVKPANILITPDNRVKITDFGIARLNTSNLTLEGQLLGTPNYMSPEQIQGKEVDHRADLFSLGVVLYEMLTRRKPFQGENLTVVTHRIVNEPFAPPDQYVKDLPVGLGPVLARCLEKDPARRFQSGEELADELRRLLARYKELNDTSATQEVPLAPPPAPKLAWLTRWRQRRAASETAAPGTRQPTAKPAAPTAAPRPESGPMTLGAPAAKAVAPPPPPQPSPQPVRTARDTPSREAPVPAAPMQESPPPLMVEEQDRGPAAAAGKAATPVTPAISLVRLGGLTAAALVVLALATVIVWLVFGARVPPTQPLSAEQQLGIQTLPLLKQGRLLLDAGKPAEAVSYFAQAERLLPADEQIRHLRQEAERLAREQQTALNVDAAVSAGLERARDAMTKRRWEDALAAAREVLALRPEQAEALQIAGDAEAAQTRQRDHQLKPRPAEPQPVPATLPPEPVPAAPAPTPAAALPGDATVTFDFFSEVSEGVLMVYAGDRQILRRSFLFVKSAGFLRKERISGGFQESRKVGAGSTSLRVYISLPGKPSRVLTVDGNFPGGSTRVLRIRISAGGEGTLTLE